MSSISEIRKELGPILRKKKASHIECGNIIKKCDDACRDAQLDTKHTRLMMGKVVLHYAAANGMSWTEAIAELTPDEGTYLSIKSMMKYPRIVEWGFGSDIDKSKWIPVSLLEEASSCAMAEGAVEKKAFKDAVKPG